MTTTVRSEQVTVLLVEDDDGDALLVRELLSESWPAVELLRAGRVDEAILLAAEVRCVLLDLGLPDVDGMEGVRRLLDARPGLAVVVLTGADSERTGAEAMAAGAQDYLVKGRVDGDALARSIRYALERQQAFETQVRLLETEQRREEAARIARGLMPAPLLRSDDTTLAIRYQAASANELGGDFYDAVEQDNDTICAVIGDVSGHGPDEAALGARLRSAWRALLLAGLTLERSAEVLEQVLDSERHDDSLFTTLCSIRIAPDRASFRILLAGHPPPIVIGDGRAQLVSGPYGPLLGVFPDMTWSVRTEPLADTWGLLLYTDGLIEGRADPDRADRLGEEAVVGLVNALLAEGHRGDALLDALLPEVERRNGGPLNDDIAICLIEGRRHGG